MLSCCCDEIASLVADARRGGLTLVATEKDLARLSNRNEFGSLPADIVAFKVSLKFEDEPASFTAFLGEK